ncbi:MAG: glutathione-disulfide reductase [Deltaproteobacteria bacterium]|nr:glutathione-disulfide reductase [Deltaproteobacteria bacterium]MCB9787050.1 glutathione-disulfide reductase [Deltaproteobacteria bacterium]
MSEYDVDFFVLGGGSGGVRAARIAGKLGARVALCESRKLGGTCVNVGCVPKKLMVYASAAGGAVEEAAGYGWSVPGTPSFDWPTFRARKDAEIARLNGVYARLLDQAGVRVIHGHGRFVGPHAVSVGDEVITARYILIATGAWPSVPEFPGADLCVNSNAMFSLEALPARAVVVGGGYIGLEFAGILEGLGTDVTLVHRGPRLLREFDDDIGPFLATELRRRGVDLRLERQIMRVARRDEELEVELDHGEHLRTDLVLMATGRAPLVAGLDLPAAGVALNAWGAVAVDASRQTSVPHIYAVGDVAGSAALTPVALAEGQAVARMLFGGGEVRCEPWRVPTAVFSQPPVATVGLTEAQATAEGHRVRVFRSEFTPMAFALSGRTERALLKLVVDTEDDRVLGFHMVGMDAAEIIQGLAVALTCGVTKAQLDATLGIHPTMAEEWVTM